MFCKIFPLFLIFIVISYVECFKTGVTRQSCTSMRPEHKRPNTNWEYAPQFTRDPPFEIKVNTTRVKPGELVEVVLTSKGRYDFFKGYFMQVFEDKSFFSKIIPFPQGSWIPLGRSRTLKCHIYEDSISHTEASYKRNVTMLWKAPMAITHPFKVKATVVRNFTHYWEDVWSPTIYPTEVISIVSPPVDPNTGSPGDTAKAKQDLLETLAKEVGADSAKELLEILKQKVEDKNKPPTTSTAAPTKTVDQKISDLKDKNPDTANKIETVAKNPSILDKVKNLFGGKGGTATSDGSDSGGGMLSSLLGGGSGLMGMLPMLMPMMGGGGAGGLMSSLMGGGKGGGLNPLSMMTSMLGGGGPGGMMSSLLGGGKSKSKGSSNPLSALMGGGGGGSNPLASLMGGGGGGSGAANPLASLMGGAGGGASNPLASLMGGGGSSGSNPLAALMGGGQGGQSNPMASLMGGQQRPGGGNPLNSLMSNPAVTSMLKSMTGGGGPRPPPSGGAGGKNLADLLGVDPNSGTPKTELAENTSGTKAQLINTNTFPQMIGNSRGQSAAGGMNGMNSNRFQGTSSNRMQNQFQGMNGQMNRFQNQQGMLSGQNFRQNPMGQFNGRPGQMTGMRGSVGQFNQGQNGFPQTNGMNRQFNQGQNGFQQQQQGIPQQNQQSTVVDMNKIQSMINGPNGNVIKTAMQDMLAGRKTAADVMSLVNSHPSGGSGTNIGSNGMAMPSGQGGLSGSMTNMAGQNAFNGMANPPGRNTGMNGQSTLNSVNSPSGQGTFNAISNPSGQSTFNGVNNLSGKGSFNGVSNPSGQSFFNSGNNPPGQSMGSLNGNNGLGIGQNGFSQTQPGSSNQGFQQPTSQNNHSPSTGVHGQHTNQNNNPPTNTGNGPDHSINPPPSNDSPPSTGTGGFMDMPDFTKMVGGNSQPSGSGSSLDLGSIMGGGTGGGLPDISSLLGGGGDGSGPDLSKLMENVDMSQVSGMFGGMNPNDLQGSLSGMLNGPQGASLMSAASSLMSGGKVDGDNPLAGILNGPQGDQIKKMAEGLMSGEGGGLSGLLGGAGGGGGLGGIMSMLG